MIGQQMNLGELIVGNPQAGCVSAVVKGAANRQSGFGTGRCDQLDDDLMGDKWLATPVLRHEREEPVFDLVPLACAWRQVADAYRDAEFALTLEIVFWAPFGTTPFASCLDTGFGDSQVSCLRAALDRASEDGRTLDP